MASYWIGHNSKNPRIYVGEVENRRGSNHDKYVYNYGVRRKLSILSRLEYISSPPPSITEKILQLFAKQGTTEVSALNTTGVSSYLISPLSLSQIYSDEEPQADPWSCVSLLKPGSIF